MCYIFEETADTHRSLALMGRNEGEDGWGKRPFPPSYDLRVGAKETCCTAPCWQIKLVPGDRIVSPVLAQGPWWKKVYPKTVTSVVSVVLKWCHRYDMPPLPILASCLFWYVHSLKCQALVLRIKGKSKCMESLTAEHFVATEIQLGVSWCKATMLGSFHSL